MQLARGARCDIGAFYSFASVDCAKLHIYLILMGSNGSEGRGFRGEGGRALVLFGFGSVWLRDLSMQLCFGFASDVFAKLHIYLIILIGYNTA